MHIRVELPVQAALQDDFLDTIAANFRALQPFVAFLDAGLAGETPAG